MSTGMNALRQRRKRDECNVGFFYAADMKLLVTGASGFVGANLTRTLRDQGHDVMAVDRMPRSPDVQEADVSTQEFWQTLDGEFDAIFHEAACTDTTVMDRNFMWRHNVTAFEHLLQWATDHKTRVIYASSAAVYGNSPSPQRVGEHELPLNVYGESKLAMDQKTRSILAAPSIPIIALRYFNVYGPGEAHKEHMASMIYKLAQQMREGKQPRIFFDGTQKRDQIYVVDVVEANLCALKAPPEANGIYNVGSGKAVSFNDIITELNRVVGTDHQPDYFDNPYSFYQNHTEADISDTTRLLGYQPQYDLRQGIEDYAKSGLL